MTERVNRETGQVGWPDLYQRVDLDAIVQRWEIRPDPDDGTPRAYRISTDNADDVALLVTELAAAYKAMDLIKRDGHDQNIGDPGISCLTCEAIAEFETQPR